MSNQKLIFQNNGIIKSGLDVKYIPYLFDSSFSKNMFETLLENIEWKRDSCIMMGKKLLLKRKTSFYGDRNLDYTYSGFKRDAIPWNEDLLLIKNKVEEQTMTRFNSVLLNDYESGDVGMGWHSDNEKELGINPIIASVSFGASRDLLFKNKDSSSVDRIKVILENGSLLIMKGKTQHLWNHSIPKRLKVKKRRINLTFRTII